MLTATQECIYFHSHCRIIFEYIQNNKITTSNWTSWFLVFDFVIVKKQHKSGISASNLCSYKCEKLKYVFLIDSKGMYPTIEKKQISFGVLKTKS